MNAGAEPITYVWWLVSRASGIVALVLISLSVLMGLAMATKVLPRPGLKRSVARLHEHVALTALLAIGAHGLSLLGDHWLNPGWRGIAVPFALSYRPQFTGTGIIGGYVVLLLGPSFYLRRRIGVRRWRKLHSLIVLAWLMSAAHTLGAGSDAQRMWLQALVIAPAIAIVYLLVLRVLKPGTATAGASRDPPRPIAPQPSSTPSGPSRSGKRQSHGARLSRRPASVAITGDRP
jgi:sulfoxide reductase heme-binding subunit YedZ